MSKKTVTRADIYNAVYREVGLSRSESVDLVERVFSEITHSLVGGEPVKISIFGTFSVRSKRERIGRNPRTGEPAVITPRRVVRFKPSATLAKRVNDKLSKRNK